MLVNRLKDPPYEENFATSISAAVSTMETIDPPIKLSRLSLLLKKNCKAGKMSIILIILYRPLPSHACFKQKWRKRLLLKHLVTRA